MDVKVDPDGTRAVVKIPGFTFHDFDRTGRLNVRSLQMTLTAARILAYHSYNESGNSFLEYDKLTSDTYTFMASTEIMVDKKLYDLTRHNIKLDKPSFAVVIQLGYVGKSSLNSIAKLMCQNTGDVFVSNINQVVAVDKATRKPKPLADWWKQKYTSFAAGNGSLVVPLIEVPAKTHVYSMKVPWTDIDNYKHTNYISYIRYCFDAAMDATVAGAYSKVKGDFLQYKVKDMKISYKGESVANDELLVKTWENNDNPYLLHYSIERQDQVLLQNTIELYPQE